MARRAVAGQAGFTLLEVLVAFAILSIAIVTLIELSSQGLRLLKLSGDHQEAVQLADRIARETQIESDDTKTDSLDSGEEGNFTWERRITRLTLPDELETKKTTPDKQLPGLYTVSVAVHWGRNQSVEVATLRAPGPSSGLPTAADQVPAGQVQNPPPGQGTPAAGAAGQGPLSTRPGSSGTIQPSR
jgi:general secretion pathway protein I